MFTYAMAGISANVLGVATTQRLRVAARGAHTTQQALMNGTSAPGNRESPVRE